MTGSRKVQVITRIEQVGLVPVVRAPSAELAERAADAIVEGGISVLEITLTVPRALEVIAKLARRFAGRALIGAGTVLDAEQAAACIDAGAEFVVSPGLDLACVELLARRDVTSLPGALTPTEVMAAFRAGADLVKVFPCSALGGAKYLKALKAPLPHVKLLPTGGVNASNAGEYLAAGASALGVGSELVDVAALERGQPQLLTQRARELLQAVARFRSGARNSE